VLGARQINLWLFDKARCETTGAEEDGGARASKANAQEHELSEQSASYILSPNTRSFKCFAHLSYGANLYSVIAFSADIYHNPYQSSSSQLAFPRVILRYAYLPPLEVEYMLNEYRLDAEHSHETQQKHEQNTQSHT
jgi:hypothetical protein